MSIVYRVVYKINDDVIDVYSITSDYQILNFVQYKSFNIAKNDPLEFNKIWLGYTIDEMSDNFRYYINQQNIKYDNYIDSIKTTLKYFNTHTLNNNKVNLKFGLDYTIESGKFSNEEVADNNLSATIQYSKLNEISFIEWYKKNNILVR